MSYAHTFYTTLALSTLLLSGCGGGSSDTTTEDLLSSRNITISNESYQVERLGTSDLNLSITIDTQNPKSLYLVLSNYDDSTSHSVNIEHSNKIVTKKLTSLEQESIPTSLVQKTPSTIQAYNAQVIHTSNTTNPSQKEIMLVKNNSEEGDTHTFYLDATQSGSTTDATLKTVVSNVNTTMGTKTLNIWVSDDSFGDDCVKKECVTQDMVDALAKTFLQDGDDNDVYDWVTNIFGEEWGADAQQDNSYLIGETNSIDILLTDIGNDNSPNGGVIGYFWSKDNYLNSAVSSSNERIMFYVDAVMFANGDTDGTWSIDDMWPKEMVSTLAHEFQHMIHFYEKTILLNASSDIWLNEMLSETVEDVIATKIEHTGPRGVDWTDGSAGDSGNTLGRYPLFNANNTLSLTQWGDNILADYSTVNAFGAFLTRNYGGAQVLHDILYNEYTDTRAVEYAIQKNVNGENKTFNDLLREWGIAVMLSDHTDLEDAPMYNSGDFIEDTYNKSTYQLGSINFFNYNPTPTLATSSVSVKSQGNVYYKIGDNLSGTVSVNLTLDGNTEATLIAK